MGFEYLLDSKECDCGSPKFEESALPDRVFTCVICNRKISMSKTINYLEGKVFVGEVLEKLKSY